MSSDALNKRFTIKNDSLRELLVQHKIAEWKSRDCLRRTKKTEKFLNRLKDAVQQARS